MANKTEVPPPEPPELEPEKVRQLIEYADKMTAFMEAEMELIHELGRASRRPI
ncbi:hypothetical protein [Arthrobacter crystallopoietes]|uniref:hypothetical protein n=1 Tax=Crystallibacter crystallopoietes TaxID=37928 RepID=UPI001486D2F6|nr:hypothetical protein [Arthrobacter crystallopoietes]QTG80138.1 hypothetical protein J5251_14800 [Arthrobacter crystallopoietes]